MVHIYSCTQFFTTFTSSLNVQYLESEWGDRMLVFAKKYSKEKPNFIKIGVSKNSTDATFFTSSTLHRS